MKRLKENQSNQNAATSHENKKHRNVLVHPSYKPAKHTPGGSQAKVARHCRGRLETHGHRAANRFPWPPPRKQRFPANNLDNSPPLGCLVGGQPTNHTVGQKKTPSVLSFLRNFSLVVAGGFDLPPRTERALGTPAKLGGGGTVECPGRGSASSTLRSLCLSRKWPVVEAWARARTSAMVAGGGIGGGPGQRWGRPCLGSRKAESRI